MYNSFRPGQIWLDTEGKRIHAHGGSVIFIDGVYYWYGENKEKTKPDNGIWHWGVRCYKSTDLYNWEDCGLIIPPEPDDPKSSLHPSACMDRPHIVYNDKTKKYVCRLKIMQDGNVQTQTILTADKFLGPYTKIREGSRPLGMSAGDFDISVSDTGKAYCYFEKVHSELICADLTEDYTDVTGHYSSHFKNKYPPYVREAPAHFIRNGKHYLITSGTTGYFPNASEVSIANDWHGPFKILGNPHPDDKSKTSYHSQISSVFKVQDKKELYIACADRWLPNEMHRKYEDYAKAFESMFNPEMTPPDWSKIDWAVEDTSIANYVWLPLRFDGDMVYIDWYDEWKIEDYE